MIDKENTNKSNEVVDELPKNISVKNKIKNKTKKENKSDSNKNKKTSNSKKVNKKIVTNPKKDNIKVNKKLKKEIIKKNNVTNNKIDNYCELKLIKKKKVKLKKTVKIILIIVFIILIFSLIYFGVTKFKKEVVREEKEVGINYQDYYYDQVKLLTDKDIYKLEDGIFQSVGIIYKDYILELVSDEYLEQGYFKIKDMDYYIDYKNIISDDTILENKKSTYLNYIPYNESIKTIDETNFYLNDNLCITISHSMTFPVLIKEDNYYGVIYENKLFYIKKDECTLFDEKNTTLKHTDAIATLVYHFTYDSANEDEKQKCRNSNVTICLSNTLFKEHLSYMKENGFYTATMEDLSLFIDGKVQLPEKTVVITIDDGYFVDAAIKVLEELDMHATLFLIGTAGEPEDYKSDNLEIHSHTYALHYAGACSFGQGSPLKCLAREKLLEDLRKSREQLNGSTVFCYPFFEYNDYAISILKEAGFEMAFIGGRRKIKVGSDKYKLPRYGIINTTNVSDIKNIIN